MDVDYDPEVAARANAAVRRAARILGVGVDGMDLVPPGRALFVCNHAFGWDVAFPMAAIAGHTGRRIWALGEHLWWKVPLARRFAAAVGIVDGTRANAIRLLEAGELVLVLPGGLREAMKPDTLSYRLLWGARVGFAKVAIRCSAPIVPLAAMGADDAFRLVGNAFKRGERWLGRGAIPLPRLRLPHGAMLHYRVGEPIVPRVGPELAEDDGEARRLSHEVRGALDELITCELAHRAGVSLEDKHPG